MINHLLTTKVWSLFIHERLGRFWAVKLTNACASVLFSLIELVGGKRKDWALVYDAMKYVMLCFCQEPA